MIVTLVTRFVTEKKDSVRTAAESSDKEGIRGISVDCVGGWFSTKARQQADRLLSRC
jgi:hypothetical protein